MANKFFHDKNILIFFLKLFLCDFFFLKLSLTFDQSSTTEHFIREQKEYRSAEIT